MEHKHFPTKWIWAEEVWTKYGKNTHEYFPIKIKRTATEICSDLVMFALPEQWAVKSH